MAKAMSVRLPEAEMQQLETLAQFDGVAVAQEIREAVGLLIEQRRNDPTFRQRATEAVDRARALLKENDAADLAGELEL
jgi:predicted DNA-binding protein